MMVDRCGAYLRSNADGKGNRSKSFAEFETMISFSGFCEPGELARFRPVEFTCCSFIALVIV